MEAEHVPVTYDRTLRDTDFDTKKMEFLKADGTTKVKLEFPIYDDQPNMELLLKVVEKFRRAGDSY